MTGLASTRARPSDERRPVHGMGGRQDGPDLRARRGQADAARLEDPLGDPHARDRRRRCKDSQVELAVYFYPKGFVPKHRTVLTMFNVARGSELDIPPNEKTMTQNFYVLQAPARIENFQPHMHMRGKAMSLEAIYPDGTKQVLSAVQQLPVELARQLHLRRRRRAAAAEGNDARVHRVARQHGGEPEQPGSEPVGRLGRSHRRRDGAQLDRRHLSRAGRIRFAGRGAQSRKRRPKSSRSEQPEEPMKRMLVIASLAVLSLGLVRAKPQPYRVVFDLTSRDTLDQRAVLRWLKEVGTSSPEAKMEVVMYAKGFELVMPDRSAFVDDVKEAMKNPERVVQGLRDRAEEQQRRQEPAIRWRRDRARRDSRDRDEATGRLGLHQSHARHWRWHRPTPIAASSRIG